MPKSKAFHSFESKLAYFDDDIELIDVLRDGVLGGDLTDPQTNNLLKHLNPQKHQHLARRQNSEGSRRNTINHLRQTVYSSYLKDLYEEVTDYLRLILEQASRNGFNANRVIGEHSFKMDAKLVLALGNWDAVCQAVTESVFQSLEAERSTLNLLRKVASKLGLDIDDQLIDNALPYLEVRHFLVHSDGQLNQEYIAKYPHIHRRGNGNVNLTYTLISNARSSVQALITAYDEEVTGKNLISPQDLMP
jgi:hypothetical protein